VDPLQAGSVNGQAVFECQGAMTGTWGDSSRECLHGGDERVEGV
jgi:hypothetical protein